MGVVKERAIAVDPWVDSFVEHVIDPFRAKRRGKLSAARVLNAMHRPKNLLDAVEHHAITRFVARVICSETTMVGRMPVLRGENDIKASLQFIGQWNYFVTARHRQGAAWQKIILKIDNDQSIHSGSCRCSWARAINLDLKQCNELSTPTSYLRGLLSFITFGGAQLSCVRACSRDS